MGRLGPLHQAYRILQPYTMTGAHLAKKETDVYALTCPCGGSRAGEEMIKPGKDPGGKRMMGPLAGISANVQMHCVVDPLTALTMDESCIACIQEIEPAVRSSNAHA